MRLLFEEQAHTVVYRDHRTVPRFVVQQYIAEILSHVNPGTADLQILDVGSGPGSFTVAIAEQLPYAKVRGVDASAAMTTIANELVAEAGLQNVTFQSIHVGEEKIGGAFDIILCSEMIHLVDRPRHFVQELSDSLRPGGVIAVRTSSQEQIMERDWYRYFPAARIVDLERHKSMQLLVAICEEIGYKTVVCEIDESRKLSREDYLSMFTSRSFSTLYLISEKEFEDGIKLMHRDLDSSGQIYFDYRTSLLIATR